SGEPGEKKSRLHPAKRRRASSLPLVFRAPTGRGTSCEDRSASAAKLPSHERAHAEVPQRGCDGSAYGQDDDIGGCWAGPPHHPARPKTGEQNCGQVQTDVGGLVERSTPLEIKSIVCRRAGALVQSRTPTRKSAVS